MEMSEHHIERRVERVQFETDRHLIVGNVTLPPEGYQSRFSDSLNRPDIGFIPVVAGEISLIAGGEVMRHPFVVLNKDHVRVAFPIEEVLPPGELAPGGPTAVGP
jgi:hypothetical protein